MDDRRDQLEGTEEAVFAPVRVGSRRSPRLLVAGAAVVVAAIVGAGVVDRLAPAEDRTSLDPLPSQAAVAEATATPRPPRPTSGPIIVSGGRGEPRDVLRVDLRPAGSHLFVHGDVFTLAIVRVTVSLEDEGGTSISRRSVDIPGGSTAFQLGAVPRFDVHFVLPDELMGDGVWVSTTAFNRDGRELASFRQSLPRSTVPM